MRQERQRLLMAVAALDLDEAGLPQEVHDAVISIRQTVADE
jgi:hypothetical protein